MKLMKFITVFVVAILTLATTACSDDEGKLGGSVDTAKVAANALYTTEDGDKVLATRIGNFYFGYDENALPTEITSDYNLYIDYENGVIVDEDGIEYQFAINSDGSITQLKVDLAYGGESAKCDINITYNSNNQLTEFSGSTYYSYSKYAESTEGSVKFNWKNGKVTGVSAKSETSEYENGDKYATYREVSEYYGIESEYENPLGQYTMAFANLLEYGGDILDQLALVGLVGKAPQYLITYYAEGYGNSDMNYTETIKYNFSYSFNSDGTIKTEKCNSRSCYYEYDIFTGSRSGSTTSVFEHNKVSDKTPIDMVRSLFKHRSACTETL